jgi:hypothetical protein
MFFNDLETNDIWPCPIAHGGHINIKTEENEGSEFIITLLV